MKPITIFNFSLLFLLGILPITNLLAQEVWTLSSEESSMEIKGTSNIHDWTSEVTKLSGTAEILFGEDGSLQVKALWVSIPVKAIQSSKGSIMDKKTYKALQAEKYPTIKYSFKSSTQTSSTTNKFRLKTKGNLTMAGTTKYIDLAVSAQQSSSDKILFEGSKKLKMTAFGVDPPTALMGALTTGDEVTINFKVVFQKN